MKTFKNLSLVFLFFLFVAMKGDKAAYLLFNSSGKNVNYNEMLKDAIKSDMVFFGELHDNSLCHWLQLELTRDLFSEKKSNLIIGMEMFESDDQLLIDEYITGKITANNFESEAKLWKNYKTDYKPTVDLVKENNLRLVATNVPRRYASIVNKKGFEGLDSISVEAKDFIAPLPINFDPEVECYKSMLEMMGESTRHDTLHIAKAQALKDATMAYFILKYWTSGHTFFHINGSYHSDNYQGIIWWLKKENPNLKIVTISTIEQDTISSLAEENQGVADYIICIPSNMTKTYSSQSPNFSN